MNVFEATSELGHEQVTYFQHAPSRLRCIVAVHSTVLGPALGGVRMWPYASESDALRDALKQSRAMTYRTAIAGLNLGGAKAVLIGNPETDKSEAVFRALGRFVGGMSDRYIATEDVGTTMDDMELIRLETNRVVGVHPENGGSGDPAPFTALGTFHGIRACLEKRFGTNEVGRYSYAVQGVGGVGYHLVKLLRAQGAKVFVTDINQERVEPLVDELRAESVPMHQIYDVDATVFSPCAMGGIINEDTVPRLKCKIVAGGAHNQLESNECATQLEGRGILYAPDYAVNAGGLMNLAAELDGYRETRARRMAASVGDIVGRILELASREKIPSWQAADRLAEDRIRAIRAL
ncbi:MAG TPA: Glu/Leu/Phe/Val dehydrogenase dimerization domain-containing protein [Steroidobacteraceae bacterium]|nr:Glu/Leu/Phe/Val dehydrogenase dimerization domain-containing protein [Steroidobacteraceae bacterium]